MRAFDFLLDTISHFVKLDESPPPGIPAHASGAFERDLMAICEHQRLSPIVSHSLERLVLSPGLSQITLERLKELSRGIAGKNARLIGKLESVASALRSKGIPFLLMGEIASSADLYPSPGLRAVDGIDLLVREKDWVGLVESMRAIGFGREPRCEAIRTPEDALHFHQCFAPCIFEDTSGDQIRLRFRIFDFGCPEADETAWHRVRSAAAMMSVHLIGAEDQLIRALLELNLESFSELLLAVDIGLILGRFRDGIDWDYTYERIRLRRPYPALYFGVKHVADLLEIPIDCEGLRYPGRIRGVLFEVMWDVPKVDYSVPRDTAQGLLKLHLLECPHLADRIRLLRRILAPEPAWMSALLGCPYRKRLWMRYIYQALTGKIGRQRV